MKVKGIDLTLMTSHLESTKSHEKERTRQLKICLDAMSQESEEKGVIFGGDLNLRDKEVSSNRICYKNRQISYIRQ